MKCLVILITLIIIHEGQSVMLDCQYANDREWGYQCYTYKTFTITSENNREIFEVKGQHLSGKNNDDVKVFHSRGKKVNFIPQSLTKFFKNIDFIAIVSADLREITKNDLKEFGRNLKGLNLSGNKIRVIEGDLFEFNPNLEWIRLTFNSIVHIDSGAFKGLAKLHTLFLVGNPCLINVSNIENDRLKVLALIQNVENSCKDLTRTTTTTHPSSTINAIERITKTTSESPILQTKEKVLDLHDLITLNKFLIFGGIILGAIFASIFAAIAGLYLKRKNFQNKLKDLELQNVNIIDTPIKAKLPEVELKPKFAHIILA
jgi:hypothetical protein